MPGRKENSRYKKKRKGFHSVQKQNMPVHHRQPTTSTSASNDSTTRSTSYNDQLEKKTSPDKLNCSLEKLERNCPLKTKEESKIFRRKRAFTELGLFDTSYPPKKQECYGSKIIDSSLLQTAINNSTICKHCKNPNSSLVLVQDDSKRHGLNETLNLQCSFCETSTIMNTNKEICRSSEINIRMAQCSLATGIGLTAMNKIQICSTLNLPHPGSKAMFNENMKKVSSSSVEEAEKSLQQSAKNVKTLLKQNCADFAEKDIDRAVGRSPKCIRKNPARWIQKNLRNINWYSCYELFKTSKFHTFLVSFMILHVQNDPVLALLRGTRYFGLLLINSR